MKKFYELKELIENKDCDYDLYYEMVKSLFVLVRPSYFIDDCYNVYDVISFDSQNVKEICKILAVVTSDRDPNELLREIKEKVFGSTIKPFYYFYCRMVSNGFTIPEWFIINKVVEVCYSELVIYAPFQRFIKKYEIELLKQDATVAEKASWILNNFSYLLLSASPMLGIDPEIHDFSDKDVYATDLVNNENKELAFVDTNLDKQLVPLNSDLFWNNSIFSTAKKMEFMFDYYKYIDICNSINSIEDIINLFDQRVIWGQLKDDELNGLNKEKIWTAMIYDAIYRLYINLSFLHSNEKDQNSFKMICKQFYEQYAFPAISEKTSWHSFFDIFFAINKNNGHTEYQFNDATYKKIMYAYKKLCKLDSRSFFSVFKENLIPEPRNTHFESFPEFYETMLFHVFLYGNLKNKEYAYVSKFKDIYRESVGLNSNKQTTDETTLKYELGWYLFTTIFNYAINQSCKSIDGFDWNQHPTNMLFTFQMLKEASSIVVETIQEWYKDMEYILSLVVLKIFYCNGPKYEGIISSIKSRIVHKKATTVYNIDLHVSEEELSFLINEKRATYGTTDNRPEYKERLNLQGKTIDRIRKLLQPPNACYTKKEIMYYCDRKKAAVEKALYQLIELGEIRRVSRHNSREKQYELNISVNDRIANFFSKRKSE